MKHILLTLTYFYIMATPVHLRATQSYPTLTDAEYAAWYPLRMQQSTMPEVEHESFGTLLSEQNFRQPIRALSVGAGTGNMEKQWAPRLYKQWGLQQFDAIEPNSCHVGPLESMFSGLQHEIPNLQSSVFNGRIEDWEPAHETTYDLIFLVHVIHWFEDPIHSLKKLRSHLSPQGQIWVVIHSNEGMPRLYPEYYSVFHQDQTGTLTAEQLSEQLSTAHIPHNLRKFSATFKANAILQGSDKGRKLLSFLLNRNLMNIKPELLQRIQGSFSSFQATDNLPGSLIREPVAWVMIAAQPSEKSL